MAGLFDQGDTIEKAMEKVRFLPPVGVVPIDFVDLEKQTLNFMPPSFSVQAAPIPADQFGLVVEASASLSPFDLFTADRMTILVPVEPEFYEPALLKKEQPDPIFEETTEKLLEQLNQSLGKRVILRSMGNVVAGALDMEKRPQYDAMEPDALPGETPTATATVDEDMADDTLDSLDTFYDAIDGLTLLSADELKTINPVIDDAVIPYNHTYSEDFEGLSSFIKAMEEKVDQSDDAINIGFLKVQTDMYRFRQMMLDNTSATRLATSPVLAQIATGLTHTATEKNINDYFKTAKTYEAQPMVPSGDVSGGGTTRSGSGLPGAGLTHMRMAEPMEAVHRASVPEKTADRAVKTTGLESAKMMSLDSAPIFAEMADMQFFERDASVEDVTDQQPIAGESLDIRTTNIAERLAEPPGPEAKSYAVATKAHVLGSLAALPINVSTLDVNLTSGDTAVLTQEDYTQWTTLYKLTGDVYGSILTGRVTQAGQEVFVDLTALTDAEEKALGANVVNFRNALNSLFRKNKTRLSTPNLAANILAGRYDPSPSNGDEAAFLSVGVSALENTLGALRKVEGLVYSYRKVIKKAETAVSEIKKFRTTWKAMLLENDQEVALLRHDLSVARSLFEEEKKRVKKINDRRADVLKNHVPFVAFSRPRTVSAHMNLPAAELHGVFEDPVPLCKNTDMIVPDALEEMIDLFREVPIKWLPAVKALIMTVNRHDKMKRFFSYAVQKAQIKTLAEPVATTVPVVFQAAAGFGKATEAILDANKKISRTTLMKKADIQLNILEHMTWKQIRTKAEDELTLSDLVESGKGKTAVAQKGALELVHMENVAGCFYAMCGEVTPKARWRWAERISTFDRPISLKALSVLPGWSDLDFDLRRDMQALVDWLYQRVDESIPDAVAMINDLVRICILLASHAPVDSIISGYISQPVKGGVGDLVNLVVDKGVASVGMRVDIYKSLEIDVTGVIEDLKGDQAAVRVTRAKNKVFDLAGGAVAKMYPIIGLK